MLSEQSLLRKNAALFAELGDEANAARCLALAERDEPHDASMPALLLKGAHDPITCDKQVAAFQSHVPQGRIDRFASSGHWIRYEEQERYTQAVLGFLAETATP